MSSLPLMSSLIVDDDKVDRKRISRLLKEINEMNDIDEAKDVDEAIAKLAHKEYDCVFIDYLMPNKTGLEFLDEIAGKISSSMVFMVTSHGNEGIAVDAVKKGAADYCIKSQLNHEFLEKTVLNALRLKDARSQSAERLSQIEAFNRIAVGREEQMIDLKRQVNKLSEELGRPAPYDLSLFDKDTFEL